MLPGSINVLPGSINVLPGSINVLPGSINVLHCFCSSFVLMKMNFQLNIGKKKQKANFMNFKYIQYLVAIVAVTIWDQLQPPSKTSNIAQKNTQMCW